MFTGDATADRIWVSLLFLACKMPFKQAKEIPEKKRNHGAKVAFPSFWCVANCIVLMQTVRWKSENFILLSFTFHYTLGVPISSLSSVSPKVWTLNDWFFFFFLANLMNYLKYFINRYPVTTHTWWGALRMLLKSQLCPSTLKILICQSNLNFVIRVRWKS